MASHNWMVSSAKTGKDFFAPSTVTPPRMYPVSASSSFTATSSILRSPVAAARALRSSSVLAGTTAKHRPWRSPRASSVLKTCSGGIPILAATVSAARSSGSTSYSRSSYCTPRLSSSRTAFVFIVYVAPLRHRLTVCHGGQKPSALGAAGSARGRPRPLRFFYVAPLRHRLTVCHDGQKPSALGAAGSARGRPRPLTFVVAAEILHPK